MYYVLCNIKPKIHIYIVYVFVTFFYKSAMQLQNLRYT